MKSEGSLSCSQEATTGPYHEQNCCNNLFDNNKINHIYVYVSEKKKFLARSDLSSHSNG
jgi:hypothetical protein